MPGSYAYFQKRIVPLEEARVPIMTHAFLYGTAVFEGVRGNWSDERGETLIFRPIEHFQRLKQSAHIMHIDLPQSAEELSDITARVVAACGLREDVYIRPIAYKSGEVSARSWTASRATSWCSRFHSGTTSTWMQASAARHRRGGGCRIRRFRRGRR